MPSVKAIYDEIDRHAPFASAEKWDNCGILAGDPDAEVTAVVTALDITTDVIEEAHRLGAELIISHHPVIFDPLKKVMSASPVGMLLRYGISAICTHTPFDMAPRGMNALLYNALGDCLGLKNGIPLEPTGEGLSVGMIYDMGSPMSVKAAAEAAKSALGCSMVRYTEGEDIRRIAISSGSGNSFVSLAAAKGADALLSGDFKHDVLIDAVNSGDIALIDCGHFYTERLFCGAMKSMISEAFPEIKVSEAESNTDPVMYI